MTIRIRIFLAIAMVSLLTIGVSAYIHYTNLSSEYEQQLSHRAKAISDSLRTELEQTKAALNAAIQDLVDQDGVITREFPFNRPANRYRWATQFTQGRNLDVLKILSEDGEILTSAHWPASYGAIDPLLTRYKQHSDAAEMSFSIVAEATPLGRTPSLEVWTNAATAQGASIILAAGRFIDTQALTKMLARSGADLVAFCNTRKNTCLTANTASLPQQGIASLETLTNIPNIHIASFHLGSSDNPDTIQIVIGVSRESLESLGQNLLKQAASTSLFGLALALLLGFYLSHRISSPLSRVVQASKEVAAGEFKTRVAVPSGSAREIHSLAQEFNTMAEELELSRSRLIHAERVATWQEIARALAHEIKNPLTPILAALRVVQRAHERQVPQFDAILAEQATAVAEEVSRLKAMADNFAKFARLPEPRSAPLDVHSLVSQITTLYKNTYPDIIFTISSDRPEQIIEADSDRLRTVFSNIVLNAAQALEGHGELRISIQANQSNAQLVILFHDTGPGIAPEIHDRLFLPYATTKGASGTGLGLALAHRIITEMGGTIELDEKVKAGACFRVTL